MDSDRTLEISKPSPGPRGSRAGIALVCGLAALAASAIYVHWQVRRVERQNPPHGRFITVDGVRLHYVERGDGDALVLLHGNGSMALDFELAGLIDDAGGGGGSRCPSFPTI